MGMYDIKQLVIDMAQQKTNSLTCKKALTLKIFKNNFSIDDLKNAEPQWFSKTRAFC